MSASSRRRLLALLALPLAAGALASCGGTGKSSHGAARAAGPPPAPSYHARRLQSQEQVSLASLRGKTVLLTSFATWCVECRTELGQIERLADRYRAKGLTVIGVSVDDGSDQSAIGFARAHGARFQLLKDADHDYQVAFRSVGVPQSELIDRQGRLVKVWQGGFDVAGQETRTLIESVLAGGKGTS